MSELQSQTREQWQLRLEGQLVQMGRQLEITPYEELQAFVQSEIGDLQLEEEKKDACEWWRYEKSAEGAALFWLSFFSKWSK